MDNKYEKLWEILKDWLARHEQNIDVGLGFDTYTLTTVKAKMEAMEK